MTTILIVEDEPSIAELIAFTLKEAGWSSFVVSNAAAAWDFVQHRAPQLVLLDWMLPDRSGLHLLSRIRADRQLQQLSVIMLTAKSMEEDKIAGLDNGADDYITKPFSTQELLARIRAVLRRRAPEQIQDKVNIGELVLDAAAHRVSWQGDMIKVGPTEFKLLHYLMKHPERVHSRAQLLDKVWGDHVFIEERTVDVHVKRLREALGMAGALIETVRGAGYRLSAQALA